ncbi:MAG: hypothetical protein R2909_14500 [Gemmatimonadales bacterium]
MNSSHLTPSNDHLHRAPAEADQLARERPTAEAVEGDDLEHPLARHEVVVAPDPLARLVGAARRLVLIGDGRSVLVGDHLAVLIGDHYRLAFLGRLLGALLVAQRALDRLVGRFVDLAGDLALGLAGDPVDLRGGIGAAAARLGRG